MPEMTISESEAKEIEMRELRQTIRERDAKIWELKQTIKQVANIMHHGGLIGKDENDVRRLTLPYWDKEECDRLQKEQP